MIIRKKDYSELDIKPYHKHFIKLVVLNKTNEGYV